MQYIKFICLLLIAGFNLHCLAKVSTIDIHHQSLILQNETYGPYEKVSGMIHFEFDPLHIQNQSITDLKSAKTNSQGLVEASANFMVLQAQNPSDRRGLGVLEASNRGNKYLFKYLNGATKAADNPVTPEDFGDNLLMMEGFTIIWVGWQYDIPADSGKLYLKAPVAQTQNKSIMGLVRSDWVIDKAQSSLSLGHRHLPAFYPAHDRFSIHNRLSFRSSRNSPRQLIPRNEWRLGIWRNNKLITDNAFITLRGDFQPGNIYEFIYQAANPVVGGIGLAVLRDTISFAKYDKRSPFPIDNGIAMGISQTGRLLRHFLYQGFNTDEAGRKAFDGMLIHTAGAGRGSFNHRFGQPSRDAHAYSAFFYPTDIFPFSSTPQRHPVSQKYEGLFSHIKQLQHLPKIFYTNSGYEYWGRAASLIHTSLDGKKDFTPLATERIYHLASAQHFVDDFPFTDSIQQRNNIFLANPLDFKPNLRSLIMRLAFWVEGTQLPPPSRYPKIKNGTLTSVKHLAFPILQGINSPTASHSAYLADYGLRWQSGIVDMQPPRIYGEIQTLVPQVNNMGNEYSGIQNIELRVPLATFAPWQTRLGLSNPEGLIDFRGSFIPFPKSEKEKKQSRDPRPSIESLYNSKQDYMEQVKINVNILIEEGFLLPLDIESILNKANTYWDWIMSH